MDASEELKNATCQFYEYQASGDFNAILRLVARHEGTVIVGTDPKELWIGYDAIKRSLDVAPPEGGVGFKIIPGELCAFVEGTTGWIVDPYARMQVEGGRMIPIRVTTIFHQEDGEWRIVHQHYSIPVPNEQADEYILK